MWDVSNKKFLVFCIVIFLYCNDGYVTGNFHSNLLRIELLSTNTFYKAGLVSMLLILPGVSDCLFATLCG